VTAVLLAALAAFGATASHAADGISKIDFASSQVGIATCLAEPGLDPNALIPPHLTGCLVAYRTGDHVRVLFGSKLLLHNSTEVGPVEDVNVSAGALYLTGNAGDRGIGLKADLPNAGHIELTAQATEWWWAHTCLCWGSSMTIDVAADTLPSDLDRFGLNGPGGPVGLWGVVTGTLDGKPITSPSGEQGDAVYWTVPSSGTIVL